MTATNYCNKPMAVKGLRSYRYPSPSGSYIMIGEDDGDAISEANRSLSQKTAAADKLEVWNGAKYVRVGEQPAK